MDSFLRWRLLLGFVFVKIVPSYMGHHGPDECGCRYKMYRDAAPKLTRRATNTPQYVASTFRKQSRNSSSPYRLVYIGAPASKGGSLPDTLCAPNRT